MRIHLHVQCVKRINTNVDFKLGLGVERRSARASIFAIAEIRCDGYKLRLLVGSVKSAKSSSVIDCLQRL